MRAFISINLDSKLKEEIGQIQKSLQEEIRGFRWVKTDLLHITLQFLGELEMDDLLLLERPLKELGMKTASFNISFSGIGAFPNLKQPRIIWIGIEEGAAELKGLALEIKNLLQFIRPSLNKERFIPHLTLGRHNKKETPFVNARVLTRQWSSKNRLNVAEFYLMQSTLHPSGPLYKPLRKFLLKKMQ